MNHQHFQLSDDEPSTSSNNHLKQKVTKTYKTIGIIRKLFCFLPRYTLLNVTNYTSVLILITIIIFMTLQEAPFLIELIQYNAALSITGTMTETSMKHSVVYEVVYETFLAMENKLNWCHCNIFPIYKTKVFNYQKLIMGWCINQHTYGCIYLVLLRK